MVRFLVTALAACAVMGCAARTQPAKAAKGGLDKEVINVVIKADPQLNRFERNPHALLLCLYQLKDPNGFSQLAQDRDGIPELLECSRFDATVVNAKQFVVQPGHELKVTRDRGEGARYIGIATGYYCLGKEKVTELSLLPMDKSGAPSGSMVRIELGAHEIRSMKVE